MSTATGRPEGYDELLSHLPASERFNLIKRYKLTNAWPKSLEVSSLKAGDTSVLSERLVLTCESIEVENASCIVSEMASEESRGRAMSTAFVPEGFTPPEDLIAEASSWSPWWPEHNEADHAWSGESRSAAVEDLRG